MALSDHDQYSGVVDIARNGIDEVIRLKAQAKQDHALIRQMMEALKQFQYRACESIHPDFVDEAITAAQVRLGEKT